MIPSRVLETSFTDMFHLSRCSMQLKSRAVRAKRDERRRAEKRIRLLVDDLRYALKKVDPPIDVEVVTYEQAVPLVSETEEWKALEGNDEARVQAWDKFVRRQRVRVSLSFPLGCFSCGI